MAKKKKKSLPIPTQAEMDALEEQHMFAELGKMVNPTDIPSMEETAAYLDSDTDFDPAMNIEAVKDYAKKAGGLGLGALAITKAMGGIQGGALKGLGGGFGPLKSNLPNLDLGNVSANIGKGIDSLGGGLKSIGSFAAKNIAPIAYGGAVGADIYRKIKAGEIENIKDAPRSETGEGFAGTQYGGQLLGDAMALGSFTAPSQFKKDEDLEDSALDQYTSDDRDYPRHLTEGIGGLVEGAAEGIGSAGKYAKRSLVDPLVRGLTGGARDLKESVFPTELGAMADDALANVNEQRRNAAQNKIDNIIRPKLEQLIDMSRQPDLSDKEYKRLADSIKDAQKELKSLEAITPEEAGVTGQDENLTGDFSEQPQQFDSPFLDTPPLPPEIGVGSMSPQGSLKDTLLNALKSAGGVAKDVLSTSPAANFAMNTLGKNVGALKGLQTAGGAALPDINAYNQNIVRAAMGQAPQAIGSSGGLSPFALFKAKEEYKRNNPSGSRTQDDAPSGSSMVSYQDESGVMKTLVIPNSSIEEAKSKYGNDISVENLSNKQFVTAASKGLVTADSDLELNKKQIEKDLKEQELNQNKAGAFGTLVKGTEYNDLRKVAATRIEMSNLVGQQIGYAKKLKQINTEFAKENDPEKKRKLLVKGRDILNKIKSLAGQTSTYIANATGQGAMSGADKLNLDRGNASIQQLTSQGLDAKVINFSTAFPIFLKVEDSLGTAIQGQLNFLKASDDRIQRSKDLYGATGEVADIWSGEKYVLQNIPTENGYNWKDPEYVNVVLGSGFGQFKDPLRTAVEEQELQESADRTRKAKAVYPSNLDVLKKLYPGRPKPKPSQAEKKIYQKALIAEKQGSKKASAWIKTFEAKYGK